MLSAFYGMAQQEISLLVDSNEHENVVTYYFKVFHWLAPLVHTPFGLAERLTVLQEEDEQFIYLALTYCPLTLADLIERYYHGGDQNNLLDQHRDRDNDHPPSRLPEEGKLSKRASRRKFKNKKLHRSRTSIESDHSDVNCPSSLATVDGETVAPSNGQPDRIASSWADYQRIQSLLSHREVISDIVRQLLLGLAHLHSKNISTLYQPRCVTVLLALTDCI